MRRTLPVVVFVLLLCGAGTGRAGDETPPGWTTTVRRLDGSARRLWYLALVTHEGSRHVTLLVAPVSAAGHEVEGLDDARIERSESGDLHQIAAWAEALRRDAEGWKRPSLRDRPAASPHVIGVVRCSAPATRVENAEHGGGPLAVGDLLFVEDVLSVPEGGVVGLDLLGPEDRWHHRWSRAELVLGRGARLGLRGTSEQLRVHVHAGDVRASAWSDGLRIHTAGAVYAPDEDTTCLVSIGGPAPQARGAETPYAERLDVQAGTVVVEDAGSPATVAGGTSLVVRSDGARRILPLDAPRFQETAPRERLCTRDQALALVARVHGFWQGEPRSASVRIDDDGRWSSYERFTGRSEKKGGSWEPRPGGLVELTYVWTPHRSKAVRTDTFRYLLDGDALVRLRPGGQVFLRKPTS